MENNKDNCPACGGKTENKCCCCEKHKERSPKEYKDLLNPAEAYRGTGQRRRTYDRGGRVLHGCAGAGCGYQCRTQQL